MTNEVVELSLENRRCCQESDEANGKTYPSRVAIVELIINSAGGVSPATAADRATAAGDSAAAFGLRRSLLVAASVTDQASHKLKIELVVPLEPLKKSVQQ